MRRKIRGSVAVLLASAMAVTALGGCGKSAAGDTNGSAAKETQAMETVNTAEDGMDEAKADTAKETVSAAAASGENTAMGRYMETEVSIPEGLLLISDVRVLADGRMLLLGYAQDTLGLWESVDGGENWSQPYTWPQELSDGYISCGAIAEDGSVFCDVSDGSGQKYIYARVESDGQYEIITPDLPETESDVEGMEDCIFWIRYAQEGKWLVKTILDEHIYLMDDTSGEIIRTYNEEEDYIGFWWKLGDSIMAVGNEEIRAYDYETGKEKELDEVLKEELESNKDNLNLTNSIAYPLLACEGEEGVYYYCNEDGIYRYAKGGTVIEQLADGSLNSLSKPSVQLTDMKVLADGTILVLVMDESAPKLLRYRYEADVPAVPDTELKVYALEENAEVQQAISMFQSIYPNYYVNLEIGMTGDDAVTASDALRTLNTEIMAGNGPDILVLDGMPLDSYMEKGILADISDLVDQIGESDGIFEQIAKTYAQDGALYAVPSRFQIPVLQADAATLDKINSLAELADTAAGLRAQDEEINQIVNVSNIYYLVYKLYCAYSTELLAEDGSIDKVAMTDFIDRAKQIFELNHYEEEYEEFYYETFGDPEYDMSTVVSDYGFLVKKMRIDHVNLASALGLAQICAIDKQQDLEYKLMPVGEKHIFVPKVIAGINGRSNELEGAKEFVSFLLSQKAQETNQGTGLPVNRAAFEAMLADSKSMSMSSSWSTIDEDGNYQDIDFDITAPPSEELDRFRELVESLDTPCLTDAVMRELVMEQAGKCVTGDLSVEEAVNTIEQKMNLYLAE